MALHVLDSMEMSWNDVKGWKNVAGCVLCCLITKNDDKNDIAKLLYVYVVKLIRFLDVSL